MAAKQFVNRCSSTIPTVATSTRTSWPDLLACYGIELWGATPVTTLRDALRAGKDLGWDVVLKATTDRLRERPGPRPRVAQHRHPGRDAAGLARP